MASSGYQDASLGNEPWARNIWRPLVRDLVSICGMWHSAAVVVWLIDPGS